MPLDDMDLITDRYRLYLCRNSLDWAGSQYLEARAEFYSLMLKLLLAEYIHEVRIVTDDITFKKFYEKWFKELEVSNPDILTTKLLFNVVRPDGWGVEHHMVLDAEKFTIYEEPNFKNMQSEHQSMYLSAWYKKASLLIDEIIENILDLSEIHPPVPDCVYCYQKSKYDLIVLIDEK